MRARPVDQIEQDWRGAESHARHVHDVQRRAGGRGIGDHLLHAGHAAQCVAESGRAKVHEHRHAIVGGHPEYVKDLIARRGGRVVDTHADRERSLANPRVQTGLELGQSRPGDGVAHEVRVGVEHVRAFGR